MTILRIADFARGLDHTSNDAVLRRDCTPIQRKGTQPLANFTDAYGLKTGAHGT